jgi:hypothetical protein
MTNGAEVSEFRRRKSCDSPLRRCVYSLDQSKVGRARSAEPGVVGAFADRCLVFAALPLVTVLAAPSVGAEKSGVLVDGMGELLADVGSGVLRTMVSWAQRSLKPAKKAMAVKK